jgi:hypothetical protein
VGRGSTFAWFYSLSLANATLALLVSLPEGSRWYQIP